MKNLMPESVFGKKDFFILIFLIIAGCAKIGAPSGGPRDKEPPHVVRSVPENGSKNFRGEKFSVTFNEYVTLDKITEKLMISPPIRKRPIVFLKGKSVNVEYEDDLLDSTTYTFNFQDAIRDLNEGNILNNFQFVFSTGSEIDSLSVTGNVYSAPNLDPPDETLVLLYKELYDSAVVKHLPLYISRIDKSGYFRIDNIKGGKYRLYALKDADNSKNYNLPDEPFAFMNVPIEVTPGKNYLPVKKDTVKVKRAIVKAADTTVMEGEYNLILFQPAKTAHYMTSSTRSLPYKLTYTLSLPPDSGKFEFSIPGVSENSYYLERSRNNDSMVVWLTDSSLYTRPQIKTLIEYPYTDTTGKKFQKQDTIPMRFLVPRSLRERIKKPPFAVTPNQSLNRLVSGRQIIFQAQTPFRAPDTSKIRLYETTTGGKTKIPFSLIRDTTNSCRIIMATHLLQDKKYLLIADHASFGNIYGEVSDSVGYKIAVRNNNTFGKVTMDIINYEGARIIQLLGSEEKVIREIKMKKDGKAEFPYLDPGKYRFRVIYDINGDGKWTTGDFKTRRQPEPVSYYPQEIEVKENWEINQIWDISQQNVKKLKSHGSGNQGNR